MILVEFERFFAFGTVVDNQFVSTNKRASGCLKTILKLLFEAY